MSKNLRSETITIKSQSVSTKSFRCYNFLVLRVTQALHKTICFTIKSGKTIENCRAIRGEN